MFPSAKNTTPFWFSTNSNFEENSLYPFGGYPKPQISDLVVLAVPFSIRDILSSVSKGEYRYGMNTQEKDNEIYGEGNSYTAEYWQYDARLVRRWNVDPKPNPRISTHAAFANNPLFFSDPNGDTIRISDPTTEKGFFNYTPNMDPKGDEYQKKTIEALNEIYNSGETGKDLILSLHKEVDHVTIHKGVVDRNIRETKAIQWTGQDVKGIPTSDGNGGMTLEQMSSVLVLGHELAHARDNMQNKTEELFGFGKDNTRYEYRDGKDIRSVSYAELYAMHIENLLRKDFKVPLRTHYSDAKTLSGTYKGEFLNATSSGY
jgi:hypothetical protein